MNSVSCNWKVMESLKTNWRKLCAHIIIFLHASACLPCTKTWIIPFKVKTVSAQVQELNLESPSSQIEIGSPSVGRRKKNQNSWRDFVEKKKCVKIFVLGACLHAKLLILHIVVVVFSRESRSPFSFSKGRLCGLKFHCVFLGVKAELFAERQPTMVSSY